MPEMVRMNLNVEADIPGMLAAVAGGQRRMGEYLTRLIRQIHAGQAQVGEPGELELLTSATRHLAAKVKEVEARLTLLEHGR